jgi:peroxiredoxin
VTALVYESERYIPKNVQIIGISTDSAGEGIKLRDRIIKDTLEDRPHIPLDPFPVTLLTDPQAKMIRDARVFNEERKDRLLAHPTTFVVDREGRVRWVYRGQAASDRPSPVQLAKTAVNIGQEM